MAPGGSVLPKVGHLLSCQRGAGQRHLPITEGLCVPVTVRGTFPLLLFFF